MSFGRTLSGEQIELAARAMNSGIAPSAIFNGGLRGAEYSTVQRRANELAADERAKQAAAQASTQAEQDAKRSPAEVRADQAEAAFRNSPAGLAKMTPEERYAHCEANGIDPRLVGLERMYGKVYDRGAKK